ncbi:MULTISPECIES: hypothetical protein [Streptomyces]|uniref:hypothetical protein n=1 Tax=Streptomyces lycopersici TaxID=2974589 RepID=UPI0021D0F769|nr:hypothetical protein [Streptomyces sp. NEAU-383]
MMSKFFLTPLSPSCADLIEPPTAAQGDTIVRSALHQADERAVAEVAARLAQAEGCTRRLDALAELHRAPHQHAGG